MKEDRSGTHDCVHIGARGGMNSDHLHTRAYCQVRGDHSDIQKRRHTSDLQCNIIYNNGTYIILNLNYNFLYITLAY